MSDDTVSDGPQPEATTPEDPAPTFRLGYVPGATPGKWARTWTERLPEVPLALVQVEAAAVESSLRAGEVDAAIARLPVDTENFHAILLYEEVPVVVVSRDHLLAATEDDELVATGDLAEDVLWVAADDVLFGPGTPRPGQEPEPYDDGTGALVVPEPRSTAEAVSWAASGSGVVVVPMSLARLHRRKDVVVRGLDDGPRSPVGLVWLRERSDDLVEEMVGIVRGRTANSSRGRGGTGETERGRREVKGASRTAGGRRQEGGPHRGGSRKGGPQRRGGGGRQGRRKRR